MKNYTIEYLDGRKELHYDRGYDLNLKQLMIDAMDFCNEINEPFTPENIEIDCAYDPYVILVYRKLK